LKTAISHCREAGDQTDPAFEDLDADRALDPTAARDLVTRAFAHVEQLAEHPFKRRKRRPQARIARRPRP
jgi:hypothetical protein